MRLDLLEDRTAPLQIVGTAEAPAGVADGATAPDPGPAAPSTRGGIGWRGVLAILVASLSLLGQGERSRVDPRFRTPSSALLTYWEALREGDADGVHECFITDRGDLPMPGALWFLPPTDDLWLTEFHSLPVSSGRVMVRYEVHFRPRGSKDERMFESGNELLRTKGEWRIAQPLGEASMPEWKPERGPVDI
jgi:hypothetical protein